MAKREYRWDFERPDFIGSHSKAKHEVIRDYVRRFLREVNKNPRRDRIRLNLVDGFSGGGVYRTGKDGERYYGSPVQLVEAMLEMERELQAARTKPFTLDWTLHLIDKSPSAISTLRRVLAERGHLGLVDQRIHIHRRAFEDAFPRLLERLKGDGKAIFILDQYGYTGVPLSILSQIFGELEKPEVIMTFAFEYLSGFVQDFADLNASLVKFGLQPTPREEYEAALAAKGGLEFLVQRRLHGAFLSVATYFTPFFITSRDDAETGKGGSNLAYWLVHLSEHHHARNVMAGLHWEKQNHFAHFGQVGQHMLGYDPLRDNTDRIPYLFDTSAYALTTAKLTEDLPRIIRDRHPDGIPLIDFFALPEICNGSTADFEIYRQVLSSAATQGLLAIRTKNGGEKRKLASLSPRDVLFVPPTPTLFALRRPDLAMPDRFKGTRGQVSPQPAPAPPESRTPIKPCR